MCCCKVHKQSLWIDRLTDHRAAWHHGSRLDKHLWLVESTTDGQQAQHQPWLAYLSTLNPTRWTVGSTVAVPKHWSAESTGLQECYNSQDVITQDVVLSAAGTFFCLFPWLQGALSPFFMIQAFTNWWSYSPFSFSSHSTETKSTCPAINVSSKLVIIYNIFLVLEKGIPIFNPEIWLAQSLFQPGIWSSSQRSGTRILWPIWSFYLIGK